MDDLAKNAQMAGIKFEQGSHWPAAWHPIVMRVVRDAARFGVHALYVKEKLGGLRIQGGGADLADAVVRAMSEADRTCVVCGESCDKQDAPNLPRCISCDADGWEHYIRWVEP
jgi:hypothetical protein